MAARKFNLGLEIARFWVFLLGACLVFLFFALLLDIVGLIVYGGWNPLLGKWPIFAGTISAVVYGSKGAVISLVISLGIMARMVLGPVTPAFLKFLERGPEKEVGGSTSES